MLLKKTAAEIIFRINDKPGLSFKELHNNSLSYAHTYNILKILKENKYVYGEKSYPISLYLTKSGKELYKYLKVIKDNTHPSR